LIFLGGGVVTPFSGSEAHQMAKALNARTVETAKPAAERREIADGLLPRLYLVIQPSGSRSWAVRYRHHGHPCKYTLGRYPAIDLASARKLASAALRAVAEGRDPTQEKKRARSTKADDIETVAAQFIERHCNRSNRPRTAAETARLLQQHVLPRLRGQTVREITRRDVLDVLDRVVDGGAPIAANRTLAAIRKLFNWCVSRDIIALSPCAGVKPPTPERSRDRVLSDDELVAVWRAADKIGRPFGALVHLLALTGQRRDEVAGMRWDELDLEGRLWALPRGRVKTDQGHVVPLSAAAVAIIGSIPRIADSPFVLTTNGTAPSSGYSKGKRKLDALRPPDMPPWRLHDLRRTVASGMARLGINLPVIEKVLNHASGSFAGIVSVYQRHSFADEKRAALEAWGQHVERLIARTPALDSRLHRRFKA
jgi:integrase